MIRFPSWLWHYLYNRYMHSAKWRNKREQVFRRYGRRCQQCGSTVRLHVHHKRYPHPLFFGWEPLSWLQPLCKAHHEQVHGRRIGR